MNRNTVIATLSVLIGANVNAADLGKGFTCGSNLLPARHFQNFIAAGVIQAKPYTATDGIPYYAFASGHTFLGLPLVAIAGWQEESPLFLRAPGTAPPTHLTLVLKSPTWRLKQAARSAGVLASTSSRTMPFLEIVSYNQEYEEPLPKDADTGAAYTRITCTIK